MISRTHAYVFRSILYPSLHMVVKYYVCGRVYASCTWLNNIYGMSFLLVS